MVEKKPVYCHFSFRRPQGTSYGIFAAAIYKDFDGKILVASKTRAFPLWKDHQFVSAIQSYEHALRCIYEWQGKLKEVGVTGVFLVTDNSILAGWIEDPSKNKQYTDWMRKALNNYKVGGSREIIMPIGLCEPRKSEKAHKFCREELVSNGIPTSTAKHSSYRLDIGIDSGKSAVDIVADNTPSGLDELAMQPMD